MWVEDVQGLKVSMNQLFVTGNLVLVTQDALIGLDNMLIKRQYKVKTLKYNLFQNTGVNS